MVIRALEKDTDQFRLRQEGEEVLRVEYPYLSTIDALMYLVNNTRPDIAFLVNCLVRHSTTPTMRHWNDIKNILKYLHGMVDLGGTTILWKSTKQTLVTTSTNHLEIIVLYKAS
jgi:hypothetical protein